jgi:hypothetical protein
MQLVSINTEHTVSVYEVAFNFDTPPSGYIIEQITQNPYGTTATVDFKNNCLILGDEIECIDKKFVISINEKINKIQEEESDVLQKHQNMLKAVKKSTGLKLDFDSAYDTSELKQRRITDVMLRKCK